MKEPPVAGPPSASEMGEDVVEFVNEGEIRATVAEILGGLCRELAKLLPAATIEHVGSTSIPETVTKGDLDVCVLVDQTELHAADGILAGRFARNIGSDRSESLSSFVDPSRRVAVGIQLVARGGAEDFFVRWRDLLRGSPALRDAYNDLKRRWHGRSHGDYRQAKSEFIERTLASPLGDRGAATK
jgi:GrpB-like predicted nucleotidyltransferase (UPF0157 family)